MTLNALWLSNPATNHEISDYLLSSRNMLFYRWNNCCCSSPLVGSSINKIGGSPTSAQAIASRLNSPPESPRTSMPPGSSPPTLLLQRLLSPAQIKDFASICSRLQRLRFEQQIRIQTASPVTLSISVTHCSTS